MSIEQRYHAETIVPCGALQSIANAKGDRQLRPTIFNRYPTLASCSRVYVIVFLGPHPGSGAVKISLLAGCFSEMDERLEEAAERDLKMDISWASWFPDDPRLKDCARIWETTCGVYNGCAKLTKQQSGCRMPMTHTGMEVVNRSHKLLRPSFGDVTHDELATTILPTFVSDTFVRNTSSMVSTDSMPSTTTI